MKKHTPIYLQLLTRPLLSGSIRVLPAVLAAGCFGLIACPAQAQEMKLDIGVRPTVVDKTILWSGKLKTPGAGGHGKIYGIVSVQEIKSEEKLLRPVDEGALVSHLLQALDANGFHEFVQGQKPEILLTVGYGRGHVHNPYIHDTSELPGGSPPPPSPGTAGHGPQGADAPTVSITGAFALQLVDEKTPGWQAGLQKAEFEKLYIQITAWQYPAQSKAKPVMLWKSVIVVDDPDHVDLNDVAAKMLDAGAPYFDKEVREPEVNVYKPMPEGHVNVGTPKVVEPKSK